MQVMGVYIISGPPAAGKSTVSERLAGMLDPCALIPGDLAHHMIFSGRRQPWVDESQAQLTWRNIVCLVKNFVKEKYDVVVDYVCYPHEAERLVRGLGRMRPQVKYVVLIARSEVLMQRDSSRLNHMGSRVLEVYRDLLSSVDGAYILDTDDLSPEQVAGIILSNERFIFPHRAHRA